MADVQTLRDAEEAISIIEAELRNLTTLNLDFHKRRITNAGPSQAPLDYVVRQEIDPFDSRITTIEDILGLTEKPGTGSVTNLKGLTNPLIESILASQDSKYDIGQAGSANRVRNIYADIVNSEALEVTDTTHTSHWRIKQDALSVAELDFLTPANAPILTLETSNIYPEVDIRPRTTGNWNVGTASGAFAAMWSENFHVHGQFANNSAAELSENTVTTNSYGELYLRNSAIASVNDYLTLKATASDGFLIEGYNPSNNKVLSIAGTSDDGRISLWADGKANPNVLLNSAGFGQANSGTLFIGNSDSTPKTRVRLGVLSGGDGYILVSDSAETGLGGVQIRATNVTAANQLEINKTVLPSGDKTLDMGIDSRRWNFFYGEQMSLEHSGSGNDTFIITNTSAAERVKIGLLNSSAGSAVACLTSTAGENVQLLGSTTDSARGLYVDDTLIIRNQSGTSLSDIAGSAGATYTATEQGLINSLLSAVNAIHGELRDHHGLYT